MAMCMVVAVLCMSSYMLVAALLLAAYFAMPALVTLGCDDPVCVGKDLWACGASEARDRGFADFARGACRPNARLPRMTVKPCATSALPPSPTCVDGVYEFNDRSAYCHGLSGRPTTYGRCPANRAGAELQCHGAESTRGPVCADGKFTAPNECVARTFGGVQRVSAGACPAATAWTCARECDQPDRLPCTLMCSGPRQPMSARAVQPNEAVPPGCTLRCEEPKCYVRCTRDGQSARSSNFASSSPSPAPTAAPRLWK